MTDLSTFTTSHVTVTSTYPPGTVDIYVRRKGVGEGLLLLHGYPQTGRYVPFTWPPDMSLVDLVFLRHDGTHAIECLVEH
jgi:hypothetical protein